MEYTWYWKRVVHKYSIIIEGWPSSIPFKNLSKASSALGELESLLERWRTGDTYWRKLTEDELANLDDNYDKRVESGEITPPAPRKRRADYGKKRRRTTTDEPTSHSAKKHKSAETVESDKDEDLPSPAMPTAPGADRDPAPPQINPGPQEARFTECPGGVNQETSFIEPNNPAAHEPASAAHNHTSDAVGIPSNAM
jgi:hypothetical protein